MTAREIVNNALTRLGYTATNGNEQLTRRIMNKALAIVNDVYSDIFSIVKPQEEFAPIIALSDNINLTQKALGCMIYGVAAFIAQSENDGDQQQWWMTVFNNKRAGLSKNTCIKDTLPRSLDL